MTDVVYFSNQGTDSPVAEYIDALGRKHPKAAGACIDRIARLQSLGFRLGRPHSAPLGDGLHELRADKGSVHPRLLYFFHRDAAVLLHGFTKKGSAVPAAEIARATKRRESFVANPDAHTAQE